MLKPHLTKDDSLLKFLRVENNNVPLPNKKLSLTETRVADLLSHLMGTAPLNPQVDRTDFPKKGFFNNPKANLMFVLDSTTIATGELVHTVSSESYPDETLTILNSILTGATPSQHGIIGDAWINKETGEKVSAFESWCPSRSGSRSASLQDVFGLAHGGRSLVLSYASKLAVARTLSTKPFLLKPTSTNYGFFWNGRAFESVYTDKTKYTASFDDLLDTLTQLQGSVSLSGGDLAVNVEGQQIFLNLAEPTVTALFAEASYALFLTNALTTNEELKALVADGVADFFSFGFSIKDLQNKYGKESSEMKAASMLIESVIAAVSEKLSTLYQGKLLAEVIYLGSSAEAAGVERQQIIEKTRSTLISQIADEDLAAFYPEVYLNKELQSEQKEEACSFLQQVLSPAEVEVHCLPDPSAFRSLRADLGNSSGDGDGKLDDEIAIFQIVLWSSIALIFATFWAAAVMFTIDASKDTMLYNQHSQINIKTIS